MLLQGGVDEVASVLLKDVQQAEAELKFGVELEERQIHVTAHPDLQIEVEGFKSQDVVLASRKVNHRIDTRQDVGTEIVVTWSCHLKVDRNSDIGTLEDLRPLFARPLLMIDSMLLPEVDSGRKEQRQMVVQAIGAKHTNREAWAVVVNLRIPLLARLRVDVAIILQLHILHMEAQEEAIVEAPLVDIRAVLYLARLCQKDQGKEESEERDKAPQRICAHHEIITYPKPILLLESLFLVRKMKKVCISCIIITKISYLCTQNRLK